MQAHIQLPSGKTIGAQGAVSHRPGNLDVASAQHRPDARKELARREGLRHVVVGAELEAHHAVRHFVVPGHHDDRHARRFAHRARQPLAVLASHPGLEQKQIHRFTLNDVEHLRGSIHRRHVKVVVAEVVAQLAARNQVVVGHK